jgi:hypothetical protein
MINMSTNFRERILGDESFGDIFNQGRVLFYSGAQPASADAAVTGTLLAQITLDGLPWSANGSDGGLIFAANGVVYGKPAAATWKLLGEASGTIGWFRLVGASQDTGDLSYNAPRIDGAVGSAGAIDFYLASAVVTAATELEVQQFDFTLPPV